MKESVLLLGAGTQSLAIIPSIHKMGYRIIFLTGLHSNYGDKSKYVDAVYRREFVSDVQHIETLKKIVDDENVIAIIPMGDADAIFLSRYKHQLPDHLFVIPEYDDFLKGYDKNQLMDLCAVKTYPHPDTVDLLKVGIDDDSVRYFPYPAMLKPNCTTGGRGMVEIVSYDELVSKYDNLHKTYGEYHLQRYIRAGGRQVKVQLCVDENGTLLAHSVQQKIRWYPVKGGSNTCAKSILEDEIVKICHKILVDINWVGFADFDTIEDPDSGKLLIMEINPRLPACIKGSVAAGVDWGKVLIYQILKRPVPGFEYRTGVILRHLGLDTLWFLHSPGRFRTSPNWFRFLGKDVFYQDMNGGLDAMPFLTGTWNNVKKIFNPEFKKSKGIDR